MGMRPADVVARTTLSRATIYAMICDDAFPVPIRITPRRSAWVEADIEQWLTTLVANSRRKKAAQN
jgi:prophage regulatory protein